MLRKKSRRNDINNLALLEAEWKNGRSFSDHTWLTHRALGYVMTQVGQHVGNMDHILGVIIIILGSLAF